MKKYSKKTFFLDKIRLDVARRIKIVKTFFKTVRHIHTSYL